MRAKPVGRKANSRLDAGNIKNRILDCRGTVALAIDSILNGDTNSIDAAICSLSLVQRELQQLNVEIDLVDTAASKLTRR